MGQYAILRGLTISLAVALALAPLPAMGGVADNRATSTADTAHVQAHSLMTSQMGQGSALPPRKIVKRLVRAINHADRPRARQFAQRRVVRKMMRHHNDGMRFGRPDSCAYDESAPGYVCPVTHRTNGAVSGSAWLLVQGTAEHLIVTRATIAVGE